MPEQIYFYPNGSDHGFPVNSREDILEILREKEPRIAQIDIDYINRRYLVSANIQGSVDWIAVGYTSGPI